MDQLQIRSNLLSACASGNIDQFKELIEKIDDINAVLNTHIPDPTNGLTILELTMYFNREEMVKILINKGCNIDSALKFAIRCNRPNFIKLLLDSTSLKITDKIIENEFCYNSFAYKETEISLLQYALNTSFNNRIDAVKTLLEYGAEIDNNNMKDNIIIQHIQQKKEIEYLKQKIKLLEDENTELKYRPLGVGYFTAKQDFEMYSRRLT